VRGLSLPPLPSPRPCVRACVRARVISVAGVRNAIRCRDLHECVRERGGRPYVGIVLKRAAVTRADTVNGG